MTALLGLAISILALAVSAVTAYVTLFRRGRILMTQPTVIYFGPDGSRHGMERRHQKVFFRTLLYSTGKRGHIVDKHIHLPSNVAKRGRTLTSGCTATTSCAGEVAFLSRKSALRQIIIFCRRQIWSPLNSLWAIMYLEVFAAVAGTARVQSLFAYATLDLSPEMADTLSQGQFGPLYLDWGPDPGRYHPNVKAPPPRPEGVFALLERMPEIQHPSL